MLARISASSGDFSGTSDARAAHAASNRRSMACKARRSSARSLEPAYNRCREKPPFRRTRQRPSWAMICSVVSCASVLFDLVFLVSVWRTARSSPPPESKVRKASSPRTSMRSKLHGGAGLGIS